MKTTKTTSKIYKGIKFNFKRADYKGYEVTCDIYCWYQSTPSVREAKIKYDNI